MSELPGTLGFLKNISKRSFRRIQIEWSRVDVTEHFILRVFFAPFGNASQLQHWYPCQIDSTINVCDFLRSLQSSAVTPQRAVDGSNMKLVKFITTIPHGFGPTFHGIENIWMKRDLSILFLHSIHIHWKNHDQILLAFEIFKAHQGPTVIASPLKSKLIYFASKWIN